MSTRTLEEPLKGQKAVEAMAASARTNKEEVVEGLTRLYTPYLPKDKQMPDFGLQMDLDIALLEDRGDVGVGSDKRRRDAIAKGKKLRTRARKLADSAHSRQRGMQERVKSSYGKEALDQLGIAKNPAYEPLAVLRQEEHLRARLLDPEFQPTDLLPGQDALDWQQLAAETDGDIRELTTVTDATAETDRIAQEALAVKREAKKALRRTRVNVARRLEGRYRQVGLDEAADKLRLKARRSTSSAAAEPQTQTDPEPGPSPSPQPQTP